MTIFLARHRRATHFSIHLQERDTLSIVDTLADSYDATTKAVVHFFYIDNELLRVEYTFWQIN